jgi:hypothetical protein
MTVQVVARSSGYVLCMYADDASVIRDTPWLAPDTLESEET